RASPSGHRRARVAPARPRAAGGARGVGLARPVRRSRTSALHSRVLPPDAERRHRSPPRGWGGRMSGTVRVGLDVGGTKTLGVALDTEGRVLAYERVTTRMGPDGVVATTALVVEALRRDTADAQLSMVGLGIPGLVDAERGAVRHAVNLGLDCDWFPIGDLLTD